MFTFIRIFSSVVTSLPAITFWLLISKTMAGEYFGETYAIVSEIFLTVSFALGFLLPSLAPAHWKRHPVLWFFGQGVLAWLVAILALGLVNLTPMCVGQENGDGTNGIVECVMQAVMVPIAFSPLEFILLCLTALPGGWLIKQFLKSEGT
jgi:hypothetical protein